MWLSIFVRSVEGVGMILTVNYPTVLVQTNYFKQEGEEDQDIHNTVYEPEGDTFQASIFFPVTTKKMNLVLCT